MTDLHEARRQITDDELASLLLTVAAEFIVRDMRYNALIVSEAAHRLTTTNLPCFGAGDPWSCVVCGAPSETDCIEEFHLPVRTRSNR